jgi:hypothetical protein
MPSPYPYPAPTVSGVNITVSAYLQNPARVQRAIENLALQRFLADLIFGQGPAAGGGSVIYDQVTASDLYLARDVQEIEPGSEFPILNDTEPSPLVAIIRKYGGEVMLTDESVRRDRRDLLNREMTRLRNTIVKKLDTVAMAALRAAPTNTGTTSGLWSAAATDIPKDLASMVNLITQLDMGYEPDTALINPDQEMDLLSDKDIRDALPREKSDIPFVTGRLGRLQGLDFIVSNRVNVGEVWVMQRRMVGGISDEVPLYARPLHDDRRETWFLHGARAAVPYITDPKSVTRFTGA